MSPRKAIPYGSFLRESPDSLEKPPLLLHHGSRRKKKKLAALLVKKQKRKQTRPMGETDSDLPPRIPTPDLGHSAPLLPEVPELSDGPRRAGGQARGVATGQPFGSHVDEGVPHLARHLRRDTYFWSSHPGDGSKLSQELDRRVLVDDSSYQGSVLGT